ncbi:MAG: glycerol kinase GlpK [Raoultibacter sp.]
MARYVIALDQGTTSSRAVLFNKQARVCGVAQHGFKQHYPQPGWVEHDPFDILSSQMGVLTELMVSHGVAQSEIDSIGITNQRETTIVWNRETGVPLGNAIVWQCRRTAPIIEEVCRDPQVVARIVAKTGLVPDAYFSASKVKWILDNTPGARAAARAGDLAFGTIDSWLIWALTHGQVHATDVTNASRTMLYNIHTGAWDPWLCDLFDVPLAMLPEVRPSSAQYGTTQHAGIVGGVPICGVAGDQQAALFGQCCFSAGQAKNTYGTGCFLLMHTGEVACASKNNLITTVAASAPGCAHTEYVLEGSVFVAGALIQWLRDEMGLIKTAADTEVLARSVADTAGVYIVPAFTGLGAPYWDAEARGSIYGLTRGATKAHVVRAALESLAYQVYDLMAGMEADSGLSVTTLNVDGGASVNNFLMQFQADLLQTKLVRPTSAESSAAGAAFLAGLQTGFWESTDEIRERRTIEATFCSQMTAPARATLLAGWADAINRTRTHF